MSEKRNDLEVISALDSVNKQLVEIRKTLVEFANRIENLEQAVNSSVPQETSDPLIYSRVLMATLSAIQTFERDNGRGITAKELAAVRNVELPTIYDHLSKLEDAKLVFWQRGTELGLQPYNAKFYSTSKREYTLADPKTIASLPDHIRPVAKIIARAAPKTVDRKLLLKKLMALRSRGEQPWADLTENAVEQLLDDAIKYLLRAVLIKRKRSLKGEYFTMWDKRKK
ncbi:MAG: hypothetical protein ACTSYL_12010 [Candidatus Thorarchaeota archaeon]